MQLPKCLLEMAKKIIAKQGIIKMSLSLTLFGIGDIQSIKEF